MKYPIMTTSLRITAVIVWLVTAFAVVAWLAGWGASLLNVVTMLFNSLTFGILWNTQNFLERP